MLLLSQTPNGGAISTICSLPSSSKIRNPNPPFSFNSTSKFISSRNHTKSLNFNVVKADGGDDSGSATKQVLPSSGNPPLESETPTFVPQESVPLEGVIQFEKPNLSANLNKWGQVALLSGGDVLALLLFSAIGRFSHGFPVFEFETFRTADPFIAGWFLSAYFLGGYGEDGRGMNGLSKAVSAATKSWALGIPLGIVIRAATSGHIPAYTFILVTMGSTAVVLIGWRALLFSILPNDKKKEDVYQKGSPFELFELLTSLVRRW